MTTAPTKATSAPVPASTPARRVLRKFFANPVAIGGLVVIVIFVLTALITGICALFGIYFPYDPNATNLANKLNPPSVAHWLGTDNLGRDVLSRLLNGSYISLSVGFVAMAVSLFLGVVIGAVSGYYGGWIDNILMRIVDALLCFPSFFLILTAVALLGPDIRIIILVIGLLSWTGTARLVRAEFLTLRETEYVRAARALGQRTFPIIFRHILPNAFAPIFVTAVVGIPDAILIEAGLSFINLGVQPPQATWGNIITDGRSYLLDAWWLIVFPGLAIFLAALSFYLVGDALRSATNTRQQSK
ncbi:MAG: ABC transporter permease [Terrimicrobiaceae bacterium]